MIDIPAPAFWAQRSASGPEFTFFHVVRNKGGWDKMPAPIRFQL